VNPKVELVEATENKDWKIKATTCEKPEIKLNQYKEAVARAKTAKQNKLWVPGKGTPEEKKPEELTAAEMLEALYQEIKVDLSPVLVEQETNRALSNLIAETQKLGLTIDQYLQAQGKTNASLRAETAADAQKTLSLEFALEEIAEVEKIMVDQSEVNEVIAKAKPEDKKELESRRYYLTSLLRRQKTLDGLLKTTIVKA
jgi:FKBP-type peptidyl-prolyl cis-trans isomerase (trigger factor)